ncbi:hypothetical protein PANT_13d00110 [Moesziomyces antarcticus T-34]|uniref:Uncharacterized protein n=1 Tax=Pseudozyma antarctica (strain T-34) TaxID=1151754 RepID=M9LX12_PSEA3|nr:hypothetical protein PANT_13d00110 [Moesziomyces antarcticus T-34]
MTAAVDSGSTSATMAAASVSDDSAASNGAIEPPDSVQAVSAGLCSLAISNAHTSPSKPLHSASSPAPAPALGASYPPPTSASASRLADRLHYPSSGHHATSSSYSTSPAGRHGRHFAMTNSASVDSNLSYDGLYPVPASPSMSEALTDSPGSVSSINSFRRGDLADIEDLDLEPELETVSECDEESSSLCSLDIGVDLDSDSERASSHGGDAESLSNAGFPLGLASSHSARHTPHRPASHGTAASDYARRKRSEWLLHNYANKIAARRPRRIKKGRITEIVEEGGECINTTVMPKQSLASSPSDWSCDVSGPPLAPPRSVSPSDTVPAIPSPLCSCVSADANPAPTGLEASVETIKSDPTATHLALPTAEGAAAHASAMPPFAEGRLAPSSVDQIDDGSIETASQASPPRLSRTSSRRNSSPVKLRPCFRRQSSQQSAASTRESSCERDPPRGRSVRFSSRPPQELRTHSPVEYDRKSCPVNNRLSPADVEELRTMKMEMGLLEARWAAVAACKPKKVAGTEGTTKPENYNAYNAGIAAMSASRERTPACGAESDSTLGPGSLGSAAARLRQQKERERLQERQRNLPHYLRNRSSTVSSPAESLSSEALSIRSKFGHAPPPPLPGTPAARAASMSPSRSTSVPPGQRLGLEPGSAPRRLSCQSIPSSHRPEIPVLTQTSPSPPLSPLHPRTNFDAAQADASKAADRSESRRLSATSLPERGRSTLCATPGSASPWSNGPASATSSIFSSTYFPSAPPTPCASYPGGNGYDSPASEFYESGSEYDMVC